MICTNQLNPCLKKLGETYLNVFPPVSHPPPQLRIFIVLRSLGCQIEFLKFLDVKLVCEQCNRKSCFAAAIVYLPQVHLATSRIPSFGDGVGEPLEEPFFHRNPCTSTCFLMPGRFPPPSFSLAQVKGSQPACQCGRRDFASCVCSAQG